MPSTVGGVRPTLGLEVDPAEAVEEEDRPGVVADPECLVEAVVGQEVAGFREPAEAEVECPCPAVEGSREVAVFREPAEAEEEAAGLADREVEDSREPAEGGSPAHSVSATRSRGGTTHGSGRRRGPTNSGTGGSVRLTSSVGSAMGCLELTSATSCCGRRAARSRSTREQLRQGHAQWDCETTWRTWTRCCIAASGRSLPTL